MKQVQAEHREWLKANYPLQEAWMPAAGVVEEAGELFHALVQREQEKLHGAHPRYAGSDWYAKLVDVIGDVTIYSCSLCNTCGWDFEELCSVEPAPPDKLLRLGTTLVRSASWVAEEPEFDGLQLCISLLKAVAESLGIGFEGAVRTTWAIVRQRTRNDTRVPVVALVGSSRFKTAFQQIGERFEKSGVLVLCMSFFAHTDGVPVSADERQTMRRVDRKRMEVAERVVVVNVGGYVGEDTAAEIEYARKLGKPVTYLEEL